MSDKMMTEDMTWKEFGEAMKELSKQKRWGNHDRALEFMVKNKIDFRRLSDTHWRVGKFDYWPTTGLFINIKTRERGRGLQNLIRKLNSTRNVEGNPTK